MALPFSKSFRRKLCGGTTVPDFAQWLGGAVSEVVVTAPDAPTVTLTAGDGQVTIAWVDGSDNGSAITSHKLYRGDGSGGATVLVNIMRGSA